MSQQPTTMTDRLANVIQVIQLGRKTGTLTVERNNGGILERGTIHFVNGLMTQASANQLNGLPAFQWLNAWGACHFTFTPSDLGVTTRKLPSVQPAQFSELEQQSFHEPNPNQHIQAQVKHNNQNRQNDPSIQKESAGIPKQMRSIDDAIQRIERMKLTRTHRRLFLLIDGHRNMADLARLMGRRQLEIVSLLQDLERADVVKH